MCLNCNIQSMTFYLQMSRSGIAFLRFRSVLKKVDDRRLFNLYLRVLRPLEKVLIE